MALYLLKFGSVFEVLRRFAIQIELDFDCKIKNENFRGVKDTFVLKFYRSKPKHDSIFLEESKEKINHSK